MQWLALHDPCRRKDRVREEEEGYSPLEGAAEGFDTRDSHEEEADGDFGPHEGRKGLDPFAVGVFAEFSELMGGEELLMAAEAIVGFDEVQAGADSVSKLGRREVSVSFLVLDCCGLGV